MTKHRPESKRALAMVKQGRLWKEAFEGYERFTKVHPHVSRGQFFEEHHADLIAGAMAPEKRIGLWARRLGYRLPTGRRPGIIDARQRMYRAKQNGQSVANHDDPETAIRIRTRGAPTVRCPTCLRVMSRRDLDALSKPDLVSLLLNGRANG